MSRVLALLLGSALCLGAQETPKPVNPLPATPVTPAPQPVATPVAPTAPAVIPTTKPVDFKMLDEGLLEEKWFGIQVPFAKVEEADFFWLKPGLDLTGKTLQFMPWDDPVYLRAGRDEKDKARAQKLTDSMPGLIMRNLEAPVAGKITLSRKVGDYQLVGRVVDANAKSTAARFFAPAAIGAAETVTWDFKIVDAKTQEVVGAFHHRVVSATVMSTVDSKLEKWLKVFGPFFLQRSTKAS